MSHQHMLPWLPLRVRHRLCLRHKRLLLEEVRGNHRIKVSDTRYEPDIGQCTSGTCSMRALFLVTARYV